MLRLCFFWSEPVASGDPSRGEKILRAAASRGHPVAMIALGRLYSNRGETREAWPWFYLAAKYNTTLLSKEYEGYKQEATADILKLRQQLSGTDLQAASAMESRWRRFIDLCGRASANGPI